MAFNLMYQLGVLYSRTSPAKVTSANVDDLAARTLDAIGLPNSKDPVWKHLGSLFQRAWFFRVWVLLEILSKFWGCAIVMCGRSFSDWEVLIHACRFINNNSLSHTTKLPTRAVLHKYDLREYLETSHHRKQKVMNVLSYARHTFSTDPRDKLFALQGIFHDAHVQMLIDPDYSKPVGAVYTEFARRCIVGRHKVVPLLWPLDILSAVEDPASRVNTDLPLWGPDWEAHPSVTPFCLFRSFDDWNAGVRRGPGLRRTFQKLFLSKDPRCS
jgi:hypothetical protein